MTAYEEKIQALMNAVYDEWNKEENKGQGKWDILNGFSEAHQIAVLFGNFNYQVGNGGLEQWIYNGYFHDDAEKLVEYLEAGTALDKRCRKILDSVYKLNQYAEKTGCDRDGYYNDPYDEDSEGGFIGDMVDCDAFDTWYYEHCGKDDWWEIICKIIDKTEGRTVAPAHQNEQDGKDAVSQHPLRVYIENASKPVNGGFTMPLPTTPEKLLPFLEGVELTSSQKIRVMKVNSDIAGLSVAVTAALENTSLLTMLDELNYLAVKLADIHPLDHETYSAALEAKLSCGSIPEMINLAENIKHFELQPAFNAEQYGEFLIEMEKDGSSPVFEKLEHSESSDERALAAYILRLEAHVDAAAYGRSIAVEEKGVFTNHGYIADRGEFKTLYRSPEDIPAEWRVVGAIPSAQERQPVMVSNTDLSALLLEMHAVGGDYMRDATYNLNALSSKGDDFFVMANSKMLIVSPADLVFRCDTHEHGLWRDFGQLPDAQTFIISVTDREGGRIMGNLCETDLKALQNFVRDFNITFTHLDAEMKDGTLRRITLEEWNGMDRIERDQMKSWTNHYKPADEERLETFVSTVRWAVESNRQPVTAVEFLSGLNRSYMAQADNPQPDMLRIAPEAAKEILAQSTAEVFRLMPEGAEKLTPIDAIKVPVYQSFREFSIRCDDCSGLEKWAQRASSDILRQSERSQQDKSKNQREEL